jgi:hypothetical protein
MADLTAKKKVVYLFGAGATHAELMSAGSVETETAQRERGLLMSNVSERVIERARQDQSYLEGVEMVSGTSGSLNIELLISLMESSKVEGWADKTERLKTLVREDIESILTPEATADFYLHRALLEFHQHAAVTAMEELYGLISLNWDGILDQAFEEFYGAADYCFPRGDSPPSGKLPLLKLHGSFNWDRQVIWGRSRRIEIIPLGANKSYLHSPYSFIWNRALEVLVGCDVLRVVGCSLSQNDFHLIDLLFKAHVARGREFEIQIISAESAGEAIQKSYGFFRGAKRLTQIEEPLVPTGAEPPENAFREWLKYKSTRMLKAQIERTRYLVRVCA